MHQIQFLLGLCPYFHGEAYSVLARLPRCEGQGQEGKLAAGRKKRVRGGKKKREEKRKELELFSHLT